MFCRFNIGLVIGAALACSHAFAVPLPSDSKGVITDRAGFIPYRNHLKMPGKIIAVLAANAHPVLSAEGRVGPPDQLCIGWNGGSYRWVYVQTEGNAIITNLSVPLPDGKTKVYPKLNMANPTGVKPWEINRQYALVEVEVNDGAGSPAEDAFVATKMKRLDGSKEYPFELAAGILDFRTQYEAHLSEKQKDLDAVMDEAARKALKDRKPTGPRESTTLMYMTWMAESEKLIVRFRTTITDGDYKYGNGINIELQPIDPIAPAKGEDAAPPRLPNGLRYGTQFTVEYGLQYEITKAGKVERTSTLEAMATVKELPPPPMLDVRKRPLPLPVPTPK